MYLDEYTDINIVKLLPPVLLNRIGLKLNRLLKRSLSMERENVKRIAVCQMKATGDKEKNLEVVSALVEQAASENVQMIFFPEACDYMSDNRRDLVGQAEMIAGGAVVNHYRALASKHNVWLSMGGLHEKDPTNDCKVFNTHVIIDSSGEIVQAYRKIHLFDVEIPEKNVRLKESDTASAGRYIVTPVKTPVGNIGLGICYDLRFPELSTELTNMGSEILTYPSAFTYATGKSHWEVLLRARAIENQCYVVAAAQVGQHNEKRRSYGHAMCVDPWGEVIADCGDKESCYAVAEIDLKKLGDVRRNMPVFQHRRSDIYSLYALSLRKSPLLEHCTQLGGEPTPSESPTITYCGPTRQFGQAVVPDTCVFYETGLTYAFVNLRCVVPGHVLVAPRRPAKRNEDLTGEEAADFYSAVLTVQKLMERVHNVKSTTLNIQDGPDAGQTIYHLHCHVMPRKPKDFRDSDLIYLELAKHDRISPSAPLKPPRTLEEMESEAAMLRTELSQMLKEESKL